MIIDPFMGAGIVGLIGVVGYFLRQKDKKIESITGALEKLGIDFDARLDKLEIKLEAETKSTKAEMIQVFQDICHERQGACGKLRDAMLQGVDQRAAAACNKISKVMEDRDRKWEKQEEFNDKVKRVLYQTKDGGKSWQLKDR